MMISYGCICGVMPNLHKKAWMVSNTHTYQAEDTLSMSSAKNFFYCSSRKLFFACDLLMSSSLSRASLLIDEWKKLIKKKGEITTSKTKEKPRKVGGVHDSTKGHKFVFELGSLFLGIAFRFAKNWHFISSNCLWHCFHYISMYIHLMKRRIFEVVGVYKDY